MDPDGFKPLTGVLRSKVADGKVGYRYRQSPVSRTGKSGITDLKVPYPISKVRYRGGLTMESRRGLGENAEGFGAKELGFRCKGVRFRCV